jgi:hypothetical protein
MRRIALALQQLANEFNQRQHELRHRALHVVRIRVPPQGEDERLVRVELTAQVVKLRQLADRSTQRSGRRPFVFARGISRLVLLRALVARTRLAIYQLSAKAYGANGPLTARRTPLSFAPRSTAAR